MLRVLIDPSAGPNADAVTASSGFAMVLQQPAECVLQGPVLDFCIEVSQASSAAGGKPFFSTGWT